MQWSVCDRKEQWAEVWLLSVRQCSKYMFITSIYSFTPGIKKVGQFQVTYVIKKYCRIIRSNICWGTNKATCSIRRVESHAKITSGSQNKKHLRELRSKLSPVSCGRPLCHLSYWTPAVICQNLCGRKEQRALCVQKCDCCITDNLNKHTQW